MTCLADVLEHVGRGVPLPTTGAVTVLPGPSGPAVAAVLGFTAHHLIAAEAAPEWLTSHLDGHDMTRPLKPGFLAALGEHLHARPGGQDVLLVAEATSATELPEAHLVDPAAMQNLRVDRALRFRDEVTVATLPGGLVTAGRGLAGRREISVEVDASRRGAGLGRALAAYGRTLVPDGDLLWAQVHPANVASLRAFLAAGYLPAGAEVLFTRASPTAPR